MKADLRKYIQTIAKIPKEGTLIFQEKIQNKFVECNKIKSNV